MTQEQLQKVTNRLNALLTPDDAQDVQMFLRGAFVRVVGVDWSKEEMSLLAYTFDEASNCTIIFLSPSESDQVCGAILTQA